MSTGQMQQRNAQNVRLLSADLQPRYEPNFAWKSACSAYLALTGLRGFWPMSSVDYATANRASDLSGQGNHLGEGAETDPEFGYDSLVPYVYLDGNDYLSKADGGAANWADITGTETYIENTYRGLSIGGWFYFDTVTGTQRLMSKWVAPNMSYELVLVNNVPWFQVSGNGAASVTVTSTDTVTATQWVFVVGRFDPSTELNIWVNDSETVNAVGTPASIFDGNSPFSIGADSVPSNYLTGRVSIAFLCAAYLSDAIVLSLFHQTRAMFGV